MFDAALWGLIQGLTEFLPISSSGHLVLVPELLGRPGPDLATSAVLHLGTLLAVVLYFRSDVVRMVRFRGAGRRLALLVVLGTVPAATIGLLFADAIDEAISDPRLVAGALLATGIALLAARYFGIGDKKVEDVTAPDSLTVGIAQAIALIPGVSRSGATIVAGLGRKIDRVDAARFSFLLGVPAIAGAGLLSLPDLIGAGFDTDLLIGMAVAFVSGYLAIAVLLRLLASVGLAPFGIYCLAAGSLALVLL